MTRAGERVASGEEDAVALSSDLGDVDQRGFLGDEPETGLRRSRRTLAGWNGRRRRDHLDGGGILEEVSAKGVDAVGLRPSLNRAELRAYSDNSRGVKA